MQSQELKIEQMLLGVCSGCLENVKLGQNRAAYFCFCLKKSNEIIWVNAF